MMSDDDNDGQMIFGELGGLNLSYRWGKAPKKPHPGNLSRPVIESGHAAWRARMLPPGPQRWTVAVCNSQLLVIFKKAVPIHLLFIHCFISLQLFSKYKWLYHFIITLVIFRHFFNVGIRIELLGYAIILIIL